MERPQQPNSAKEKMETHIVNQAMTLIRARNLKKRANCFASCGDRRTESQALLGQIYNAGWGVPVDYEQAFKCGHARLRVEVAMVNGGWVCFMTTERGSRIPKSCDVVEKSGREWEILKPRSSLAFSYDEGRGVERDLKECARLFKIAAEAGEPARSYNNG